MVSIDRTGCVLVLRPPRFKAPAMLNLSGGNVSGPVSSVARQVAIQRPIPQRLRIRLPRTSNITEELRRPKAYIGPQATSL